MTGKELPPYVNATGILNKLLFKIKEAAIPPRFTQDFLATKLNLGTSGSTMAMIPFLKKVGFLGTDGVPTELYKRFRNPDSKISGNAVANAMKVGYKELYDSNEYFHTLEKDKLKNFLVEVTGSEAKSSAIASLVNTIEVLKSLADFSNIPDDYTEKTDSNETSTSKEVYEEKGKVKTSGTDFNIAYTINLNLPETADPAVFDAIFKSLKEHILKNE